VIIDPINFKNQIYPLNQLGRTDWKRWRIFNQRMTALIMTAEIQGKTRRIDRLFRYLNFWQRRFYQGTK
jgi:hypothetical protein